MESFKEYIELREERELEIEMLNEDPLTIAATILGYAFASLAIGWGGALIIQGYAKLANKSIAGIKRAYRKMTGKNKSNQEIVKEIRELKVDNKVKIERKKQEEERMKYLSELEEVFAAIEEKDANKVKEKLKNVKLNNKIISKQVIIEATKVFGEPPLHYGTTGNNTYLFIKKILGMKTAQAASIVVKKALEKTGTELVQGIEEE